MERRSGRRGRCSEVEAGQNLRQHGHGWQIATGRGRGSSAQVRRAGVTRAASPGSMGLPIGGARRTRERSAVGSYTGWIARDISSGRKLGRREDAPFHKPDVCVRMEAVDRGCGESAEARRIRQGPGGAVQWT
jgi:hypothetical protein